MCHIQFTTLLKQKKEDRHAIRSDDPPEEPEMGLEPTTYALRMRRSTD